VVIYSFDFHLVDCNSSESQHAVYIYTYKGTTTKCGFVGLN